jgi:two-component system chemotaxis response regulator CheB
VHVMVVDDSAVVRQGLIHILSREPGLVVTAVPDPLLALDRIARRRPDVIVLDLVLPRMDGHEVLRRVMAQDPIPVVVCAEGAGRGTEAALRAVEEGAVSVIAKPPFRALGAGDTEAFRPLIDEIRAAAQASPRRRPPAPAPPLATVAVHQHLVALGASTGGTEALRHVLEPLPPDAPPIVIVQHMPEGFTRAFAERLDRACRIRVKEAVQGDHIERGLALVAPGNRHLEVARRDGRLVARLVDGPPVNRHRPSVDVLFDSVARVAGPHALGVVMTGMGDDGARGLLAMRAAGARTAAQDEASSVVYGMPKEAVDRRAAEDVVPLSGIAAWVLSPPTRPRRHRAEPPGAP